MQISQTIQEEIHGMLYMLKIKLKKRINIIIRKRQQGSMTVEAAFIVPFFSACMDEFAFYNKYLWYSEQYESGDACNCKGNGSLRIWL